MTDKRLGEIRQQMFDVAAGCDMKTVAGIIAECQTAFELYLISPKMLSSEYSKTHQTREERDAIIYLQVELARDERVKRAFGQSATPIPTT